MQIVITGTGVQIDDEMVKHLSETVEFTVAGDFDVRTNYSGRGMYGKECIGIVAVGPSQALAFITALLNILRETHSATDVKVMQKNLLREMHEDNMGRDMIYYFTNLQLI